MAQTYLLSRTLDPLLGVLTGLLAYTLRENNPRFAPPPGHTLKELASWKWEDIRRTRAEKMQREGGVGGTVAAAAVGGDAEWEGLRREIEGAVAGVEGDARK